MLEMIQNKEFLDVVEKIIGPDIVLHHTKLFEKAPKNGAAFPLHQDWSYFPTDHNSMIAAVIHLSDSNEEMGCVRIVPGSHNLGRVEDSDGHKYNYETVDNDITNTLIYTLDNGLKIYMSINKDEPRIQTNIAVNTGSKQDPSDATGLAHYLEHMVFKGTSKIATINWDKEKVILSEISNLYEKRRNTTDSYFDYFRFSS
mgnify:CR=1 FL=1